MTLKGLQGSLAGQESRKTVQFFSRSVSPETFLRWNDLIHDRNDKGYCFPLGREGLQQPFPEREAKATRLPSARLRIGSRHAGSCQEGD